MAAGQYFTQIFRKSRFAHICFRRGIAMYVIEREIEGATSTWIGSIFHIDHSTVLHWLRRVENDTTLHTRAIIIQAEYERIPHPEAVEGVESIVKEMTTT